MLDVAFRLLFFSRAKLAITVAGVAFAVTLVMVQVGLFRGLLSNATVTIEQADADVWITSHNTPNVDFPQYFPDTYVDRVRSVPGVARADNLLVGYTQVQLPTGAQEMLIVYGVDHPETWRLPWKLQEGTADELRGGHFMVLDASAARRFGPFALGEHRELLGQRFEVVGKSEDALSFTTVPLAFMSFQKAQDLQPFVFRNRTAYVLVKLRSDADRAEVTAQLRRALPYSDVYLREDWATKTRDYWVVSTGLGLNTGLTVFLGVLVGITVVAQTLYMSTLDYIKEFGTLKAMGAENAHIYKVVGGQGLFAALFGYVLAIPPTLALRALARLASLHLDISATFALSVLAGTVVLCLGASALTFRRIAHIDPALVFRG